MCLGLRTTDVKVPVCYITSPNLICLQETPKSGPVRQLGLVVETSFFFSQSTTYTLCRVLNLREAALGKKNPVMAPL